MGAHNVLGNAEIGNLEYWEEPFRFADQNSERWAAVTQQKAYPNLSRDSPHQRDLNCPEEWP
jgi:hypothetical protein